MARKAKTDAVMDVPVSFGNVSIGDRTARVGVSLDREHLSVTQADRNLVGRRLTGRIECKEGDAHGDQGNLDGFDDPYLNGIFDVKGISVSQKEIGFGLTFSVADVDLGALGHFAKRNGRLIVEGVEFIPESDQAQHGDEGGD